MANCTHNVCLPTLAVNRIAHGFTIDRKAFIFGGIQSTPLPERLVQSLWRNPDQGVTNDIFAGDDKGALFIPAPETGPCILPERLSPLGNSFVTHTAT